MKDSWSSGAVLEQSSHLLLDGIQTDTGGVVGRVGIILVSSTSSLVNGPPYLFIPQVNTTWNILLPVGEGTAMLRDLVLPRILEHFVDILMNGLRPGF